MTDEPLGTAWAGDRRRSGTHWYPPLTANMVELVLSRVRDADGGERA